MYLCTVYSTPEHFICVGWLVLIVCLVSADLNGSQLTFSTKSSIQNLRPSDICIRLATSDDLPTLALLERHWGAEELMADEKTLSARLSQVKWSVLLDGARNSVQLLSWQLARLLKSRQIASSERSASVVASILWLTMLRNLIINVLCGYLNMLLLSRVCLPSTPVVSLWRKKMA